MPRTTRKTRKKGPGLAPTVDVALVNNLPEQFNNESEYIFKSQHHHRSYIWAEPEATIVKSEQVTPVRKGAVPVARELPQEHFIDANEIYEEIRDLKMIIASSCSDSRAFSNTGLRKLQPQVCFYRLTFPSRRLLRKCLA